MTAAVDLRRATSARERDLRELPAHRLEVELRGAWGRLGLRERATAALVALHERQPGSREEAVAAVLAVEAEVRG